MYCMRENPHTKRPRLCRIEQQQDRKKQKLWRIKRKFYRRSENHAGEANRTGREEGADAVLTEIYKISSKEVRKVKTIQDVAKELGVSTSTVSRAISGKGRIGKETRERVLKYIEENGYYPNAAAQSLAQSKTNNIAIILPEVDTLVEMPFFHTCMYAVEEMAQANDYDILVVITSGKDPRPLERLILNRKVDGMILTRTYENDCFVPLLLEKKIPFVTIGQTEKEGVVQIDSDNAGACMELTSVLLSKRIGRIAYLGGSMEQMVNKCRYKGYLEAYRQFGKEPESGLICMNLVNKVLIGKAVEELVKKRLTVCCARTISSVMRYCIFWHLKI